MKKKNEEPIYDLGAALRKLGPEGQAMIDAIELFYADRPEKQTTAQKLRKKLFGRKKK